MNNSLIHICLPKDVDKMVIYIKFLPIVNKSIVQVCLANSIGQNGMIKVPAK
jgi:hypothetical protein